MIDPAAVALRFAVYLSLSLVFGTAAYAWIERRRQARAAPALLLLAALAASAASLVILVASMGGVPPLPVDRALLRTVLGETTVGTAFLVRFAALGGAVLALTLPRGREPLVAIGSGVALASLAWTGHGALHDGIAGAAHLASTVIHLLAAGVWIGGIAGLLHGLHRPGAPDALRRFARIGTIVVALLAATGIANLAFVVGIARLGDLPDTAYGRLLLVKLAGFAGMLALAAVHRWHFVPRLHGAPDGHPPAALRATLTAELLFALTILAIVAALGTLAPDA